MLRKLIPLFFLMAAMPAFAEDRAAITKMRREAMEKPESLEKKTAEQLTLLIQRQARDLQGDMPDEERRDSEAYLKLLRKALAAKGGVTKPEQSTDKKAQAEQIMGRLFPGKTWDQLNAKQKTQVADQVK